MNGVFENLMFFTDKCQVVSLGLFLFFAE